MVSPVKPNTGQMSSFRNGDDRFGWTRSRRFANYFSSNGCYNPSSKRYDDSEESGKPPPQLDRGWEYFEYYVLPRCTVSTPATEKGKLKKEEGIPERTFSSKSAGEEGQPEAKEEVLKKVKGILKKIFRNRSGGGKYTRANVGERKIETTFYPVWKTPIYDMADFGLGVGYYFTTLRFLTIVTFIAGCINIPNMVYFDSNNYAGDHKTGSIDIAWQNATSLLGFGLRGSGVCTDTSWEICPDCMFEDWSGFPRTNDRLVYGNRTIDGEVTRVPFILKNGCNVNNWFGSLSFVTLLFVIGSLVYWILSLNKRIKLYDEAIFSSRNYSIEIKNPPDVEESLSPEAWKDWLEATFDVEVVACTITLNNRPLMKALIRRRELLLQLQLLVPPEDIESALKDMDTYLQQELKSMPRESIFSRSEDPAQIITSIKDLTESIDKLSKDQYKAMSVFITFQMEEQQQLIMDTFAVPPLLRWCKVPEEHKFHGQILLIAEAAEPTGIRWDDLNVPTQLRVAQVFFTFVTTIALILGIGGIIFYARSLPNGAFLSSIAIEFFSVLTPLIVKFVSAFELHRDESSADAGKYYKMTLFRWVTTVVVIAYITPFTDSLQEGSYLLDTIFNLFLVDLVTTPIFQLTDPFGNFKRHIMAPRKTSQEEMDLCFRDSSIIYDIGERYTKVTTVLFLTLFYCTIFPTGFFFAFAIFFSVYWLDKFSILRSWRQGPMVGTAIPKMSNIFFLLCIIAYALTASYAYSHFPFDNACEVLETPEEEVSTVTAANVLNPATRTVTLAPSSSSSPRSAPVALITPPVSRVTKTEAPSGSKATKAPTTPTAPTGTKSPSGSKAPKEAPTGTKSTKAPSTKSTKTTKAPSTKSTKTPKVPKKVPDEWIGKWNVQGNHLRTVVGGNLNITAASTEYQFCDQNLFKRLVYPPLPSSMFEDVRWMNDSQADFSHIYAWASVSIILFVVGTIILWLFSQFLYATCLKKLKKVSSVSQLKFNNIPERIAYVPQAVVQGTVFPLLLCNIDDIDHSTVGWNPIVGTSYDDHNLIFDVKHVATSVDETRKQRKEEEMLTDGSKNLEDDQSEVTAGSSKGNSNPLDDFSKLFFEQGIQIMQGTQLMKLLSGHFKKKDEEDEGESERNRELDLQSDFSMDATGNPSSDDPGKKGYDDEGYDDEVQSLHEGPVFAIVQSWSSKLEDSDSIMSEDVLSFSADA